jgi:hypothetical protein
MSSSCLEVKSFLVHLCEHQKMQPAPISVQLFVVTRNTFQMAEADVNLPGSAHKLYAQPINVPIYLLQSPGLLRLL